MGSTHNVGWIGLKSVPITLDEGYFIAREKIRCHMWQVGTCTHQNLWPRCQCLLQDRGRCLHFRRGAPDGASRAKLTKTIGVVNLRLSDHILLLIQTVAHLIYFVPTEE